MAKIPFKLTPAAWTLKKGTRLYQRAEAEHYYEGEELEYKLLDIDYDDPDAQEYRLRKLKLDKKYNKIDDIEFEKQEATILGKAWSRIVGEHAPGDGLNGLAIKMDWNDFFIQELKDAGYEGVSEDQIVNQYIGEICYNVAMEEGIIDNLAPMQDYAAGSGIQPGPVGPTIRQTKREDGGAEYS